MPVNHLEFFLKLATPSFHAQNHHIQKPSQKSSAQKSEKKTPGNVRAIGPSRAASSKELLVIHCLEKFAADCGNLADFWLYWVFFIIGFTT
jgi:hypothetical protein